VISLAPNFGGKSHAPQFLAGNIFKAVALSLAGAVFYLYKINCFGYLGDYINFANFSFPVAVNYLKTLLFQQISYGGFGF
jgi:hypothetical protein